MLKVWWASSKLKNVALIHYKPLLPTLIPTNHVSIVIFMNMMQIITSHCNWNYDKANHKSPMLIRAIVLRKVKMKNCNQQGFVTKLTLN
jgi:hypothetical protein